MLLVICSLLALSLLIALLAPFWLCEEGILLPTTIAHDPERLQQLKDGLVRDYREDEDAFQQGLIAPREWHKRRAYLINRYVDLSRRLDYLSKQRKATYDV